MKVYRKGLDKCCDLDRAIYPIFRRRSLEALAHYLSSGSISKLKRHPSHNHETVGRPCETTPTIQRKTTLQMASPQTEPAMDEFRAGVTACLRSWSALRTAVESGWGGNESHQKAEDLRSNILQHLDGSSFPPKSITEIEDLEDNLAIYMEEEFSVSLEDGSDRQVADTIWRMYEACCKGDTTLASQVVAAAESAVAASVAYPSQIQSNEHDGEDEDMMDADGAVSTPVVTAIQPRVAIPSAKEYAEQPLFEGRRAKKTHVGEDVAVRQLGEAPVPAPAPIEFDDDGFAPVSTKGRRKAR